MAMGMAAAARLPPAAACRTRLAATHPPLLTMPPIQSRSRLAVAASAQNNFSRAVVQTAWRVGKDAVEAGTTLVPGSVPRPIARIGVTFVAVSVALLLVKSVVSTAFFVLAMTGLIYFGFLAMNPKEGGSKVDGGANSSEDPVEEARRIMEKYK